ALPRWPVGIVLCAGLATACGTRPTVDLDDPRYREWNVYHGDRGGTQYSSLDQINRDNVGDLEVAWTFSAGDLSDRNSQIQCNPIIVGATLYCTSPQGKAFALDAATGEPRWIYDPFERMQQGSPGTNRGVVYWDDGDQDRRIFFVAAHTLHAVDADTGEPISTFEIGRASCRERAEI